MSIERTKQQHDIAIVAEFTAQATAFNAAPVMRAVETLQSLIDIVPEEPDSTWVEVACGPGLVSRELAPKVGQVVGIDLTPAMLRLGHAEATRLALDNVAFAQGDALRLSFADRTLDGAVTRFSLHHIPAPGRVVREMTRVVRPGGWVLIGDHITSEHATEATWHQEIERLRDPSHWACLTPAALRRLGERAGLHLISERLIPMAQDFGEWISRGSGGLANRAVIEWLLRDRPEQASSFRVRTDDLGNRTLHLLYWLALWQRPAG